MSRHKSGINFSKNPSKVIGIQFSILSPDEIRKSSVAHITTRDTYVNNKPVIGGIFDPRMGVLEPGMICPTDGMNYINCPGYFGHIKLAKPVFWVQHLDEIINIMKCVCHKCGKLLISKRGFPGNLCADILEGIKIKTLVIFDVFLQMRPTDAN